MIAPPMAFGRGSRAGRRGAGGSERTTTAVLIGCGRLTAELARALRDEGVGTWGFDDAEEGLTEVEALEPDLVVVGSRLPEPDPYQLLEDVSALETPPASVLFLADRSDRRAAEQALLHGADDVLPPPHSVSAILLRAQVLASRDRRGGGEPRGTGTVHVGPLEIDLRSRRILEDGRPVDLSRREFELLVRLLEAEGRVVSRETLLADIWGSDQDSEAVLDATVHRLRRKLEADVSEPRYVTTVRGIGYRLETRERALSRG